jgi:EmrB/QacA subfamily drug resistance transporter
MTTATDAAIPAKATTITLVGLILAVSMTTIDQTIVALSAPTIQNELGLTHDGVQWAVNSYLLAMAAFFLLGGKLADVLGHKKMVIIGTVGFAAMSLLCGLTPAGGIAEFWLVTARALQGASGALMFPAAIGVLVGSFPQEGRAKAMATFFAVSGAMTAVGPIAGGYLTAWTWRSIFWINIPIAIAAIIILAINAAPTKRKALPIDWLGAIVVALGMGFMVFGLQQASAWGWPNPAVWGSIVVGVALVVLFVFLERRTAHPLVTLRAFADRGFSLANLAILFASFAFLPAFFFLSVYGQVSLGLTATNTGLIFLKFFIGFVIASQIGARMFDERGAKPVLAIGGVLGTIGFAWLAVISTDLSIHGNDFFNPQIWPLLVAGAGVGFMFSAASTDAVNRAIGTSYGEVSAVTQTMKNFGGAIGLAVLATFVTNQLTTNLVSSFTAIGGTADQAQQAVNSITGADASGSGLSSLPSAVQAQILQAVQADYANAVQWAFFGMAAAMFVLLILAALYPRKAAARVAVPGDASVAPSPTAPAPSPIAGDAA